MRTATTKMMTMTRLGRAQHMPRCEVKPIEITHHNMPHFSGTFMNRGERRESACMLRNRGVGLTRRAACKRPRGIARLIRLTVRRIEENELDRFDEAEEKRAHTKRQMEARAAENRTMETAQRDADVYDVVFTCGHPKRNGDPCQRRVKSDGQRCYQHA